MNVVLEAAKTFLSSPQGVIAQATLGWIVLDALLTAALEKKLNRFAPEAFSYFLEKIGGEYVGILILCVASYLNPILWVATAPALGAFVTTEANGAYQKIQAFISSLNAPKA